MHIQFETPLPELSMTIRRRKIQWIFRYCFPGMLNFVALRIKGFGEMLNMEPWLDQEKNICMHMFFCSLAPETTSQLNKESVNYTFTGCHCSFIRFPDKIIFCSKLNWHTSEFSLIFVCAIIEHLLSKLWFNLNIHF